MYNWQIAENNNEKRKTENEKNEKKCRLYQMKLVSVVEYTTSVVKSCQSASDMKKWLVLASSFASIDLRKEKICYYDGQKIVLFVRQMQFMSMAKTANRERIKIKAFEKCWDAVEYTPYW